VKLHKDLREFVELLNSHGVEYVVVGGHAVAFHGHPRFTGDIDFLLSPTPGNAARVLACLHEFGFADLTLTEAELVTPGRVIQLGRAPNRIDLLTSISGVSYDEAWQGRVAGELDGLPVSYLGLEALLRNKRAAGRSKDAADVEQIERVQRIRRT
jgi:hypothetical protein